MPTENCLLTKREVEVKNQTNSIYYKLRIANIEVEIFLCRDCGYDISNSKIPSKEVIEGLIANDLFPKRVYLIGNAHNDYHIPPHDSTTILIPNFFDTVKYPKTPSEKMFNFLNNLAKMQRYDGEGTRIRINDENIWIKGYFKNPEECRFYFLSLIEEGYLQDYTQVPEDEGTILMLSIKGLVKLVELEDEGVNSKSCFIAMKFDQSMEEARNAIKKAILKTGFHPFIVDEEHLNSDKTIPDGILSGIRKSKFCISDFTHHNNGVYFESGYALGLGKPVIYVCHESEFNESHFDIKQLQHIIYKSPEDLEKKLIDKIEAWI